MRRPSGENTALVTDPLWPGRVASGLPSAASHSRAVLSSEAVRMRRPSGENTALVTDPVWPCQGGQRFAVRRVPQPRRFVIGGGQDAAAVGREHRADDRPVWPCKVASCLPVAVPQPRRSVETRSGCAGHRENTALVTGRV